MATKARRWEPNMTIKAYQPDDLFQIGKDNIKYKESNSLHQIRYNQGNDQGILDISTKVPFIHFPSLSKYDFIKHGFSTRLGGVSSNHLSTMNLSFDRGDSAENVTMNYDRICHSLKLNNSSLVFSDQIHDSKIHKVTHLDAPKTKKYVKNLIGFDGLITNEPNLTLVTSYADCVPLYFVDPVHKAIGLSHSGWKGTVQKIGLKTIQAMKDNFDTDPTELIAVIGPSICFDCYEISEDVAMEFKHNFSPDVTNKILFQKENGKYQLDLWLTNQAILLEAGMQKENISNSNICTCCNSNLLFSHRASNGQRGNLAGFLCLV